MEGWHQVGEQRRHLAATPAWSPPPATPPELTLIDRCVALIAGIRNGAADIATIITAGSAGGGGGPGMDGVAGAPLHALTLGAGLNLALYSPATALLAGYIGRLRIVSRVAKTGEEAVDRRHLAEEAVSPVVWQVTLCGVLALKLPGAWGAALRKGFTTFRSSPGAVPAFGIGLLYSLPPAHTGPDPPGTRRCTA